MTSPTIKKLHAYSTNKKPVKPLRARPTNKPDLIFWWLAKSGAIPGGLFSLPLLLTVIFFSVGLIYHYGQTGAWIGAALLTGITLFAYTIRQLTLSENKLRLRLLAMLYSGVLLSLLLATLGFQLWGFK